MKKPLKVFHWLPRIICILAILFVSLFAADAFSPELTIWQQLGAFIMHLIPSFILIAFLIIERLHLDKPRHHPFDHHTIRYCGDSLYGESFS